MTITPKEYTKHYYANGERLATSIGAGGWCHVSPDVITEAETYHEMYLQKEWINSYIDKEYPFEYPQEDRPILTENEDISGNAYDEIQYVCPNRRLAQLKVDYSPDILWTVMHDNCDVQSAEDDIFYRHSDHLGSASWITEHHGDAIQYLHYMPYGQLLVNQMPYGYDERYKFTGKERDAETGYDYFGARFYAPSLLHWTTVDPLSDKYPGISPYAYCSWNPIKYIDPDGRDIYRYDKETGDIKLYQKTDDNFDQFGKFKFNRKTGEYEPRTNKDGSIKTYTDHRGNNDMISKGILRDGLNIKQNGGSFISNDDAGPTINDYFNFALILDEVTGVEISGFVLEAPGERNRKVVQFEPYKDNSIDKSNTRMMNLAPYNVLLHFHTHGHADTYTKATTPSPLDVDFKNIKATPMWPGIQLLILHNYGSPIRY